MTRDSRAPSRGDLCHPEEGAHEHGGLAEWARCHAPAPPSGPRGPDAHRSPRGAETVSKKSAVQSLDYGAFPSDCQASAAVIARIILTKLCWVPWRTG